VIFDPVAPASSGPGATLKLENPLALHGEVGNWQVGDVIDINFLNTKVESVHEQGSHLTVTFLNIRGESFEATYRLVHQQAHTQFQLQSDGHGGTNLILVPIVGVGNGQHDVAGHLA
jgi:hypothetical protein